MCGSPAPSMMRCMSIWGLEGKRNTTADAMFTLETVACLGACGLAPKMTIDGEVFAKMTPETAIGELEAIRGREAAV